MKDECSSSSKGRNVDSAAKSIRERVDLVRRKKGCGSDLMLSFSFRNAKAAKN
jgi:molybdate-binding protein